MNLITKHCIAFLGLITVSLGLANHCQAHDTAKEFSDAAAIFLKSLDDDQTKAVQFKFDDPLRKDWHFIPCLLYTSPSPRDRQKSRMPSSA